MVKEKYILDLKQYGLLEKLLFYLMFIFLFFSFIYKFYLN